MIVLIMILICSNVGTIIYLFFLSNKLKQFALESGETGLVVDFHEMRVGIIDEKVDSLAERLGGLIEVNIEVLNEMEERGYIDLQEKIKIKNKIKNNEAN